MSDDRYKSEEQRAKEEAYREYLRLRAMSPEAFAEWKEAREREAEEEGVEKLVSGRRSKTQL